MRSLIVACAISATAASADSESTRALNDLRADAGRASVSYSDLLARAAERHADDMLRTGQFSHTGSDGSSVADRVSAEGYGWCVVAENIAKGQSDLEEVMAAWAASPGHNQNMLSNEVTEFGLIRGEGNTWVMVLARPGC